MLCLARCYGNAQHCTAATRCVSVAYAVTRQSASVTILTKHNLYSKRRSINEKRFLIGQMSHLRLFAIPQSNTRPPARLAICSLLLRKGSCARGSSNFGLSVVASPAAEESWESSRLMPATATARGPRSTDTGWRWRSCGRGVMAAYET